MAEVGRVVRGDAADVHPGHRAGCERADLAGGGVVDAQRRSRCRAAAARDARRAASRAPRSEDVRASPAAQNGGQGMAGQSPDGCGWTPVAQQAVAPAARAARTSAGQQLARAGRRAGPSRSSSQRRPGPRPPRRQRLAAPLPQHGPQLVLDGEADPVVDALHPAVRASGSRWPPLRSALFTTTSNTAIRRRSGWSLRASHDEVDRLVDVDPQLAPCPARTARRAAPSGGTRSQPVASETTYAATSRAGERAVGEVPQRPLAGDRLVDAGRGDAVEGDRAVQRGVRRVDQPAEQVELPAGEQRPGRARPAAGGDVPSGDRSSLDEPSLPEVAPVTGAGSRSAAGRCARSGRAAGCRTGTAAGPRRPRRRPAWRTPGRRPGSAAPAARRRPRPRRRRRRQRRRSRCRRRRSVVLVVAVLGQLSVGLDDHRSASPSQASAIVPTRNSSSTGASSGAMSSSARGATAGAPRAAGAAQHLVEQLVDPLGERGDLLLLQRHGRDPLARPGLQEERALAGLADGAGDEPVRRVVVEDLRHWRRPYRDCTRCPACCVLRPANLATRQSGSAADGGVAGARRAPACRGASCGGAAARRRHRRCR